MNCQQISVNVYYAGMRWPDTDMQSVCVSECSCHAFHTRGIVCVFHRVSVVHISFMIRLRLPMPWVCRIEEAAFSSIHLQRYFVHRFTVYFFLYIYSFCMLHHAKYCLFIKRMLCVITDVYFFVFFFALYAHHRWCRDKNPCHHILNDASAQNGYDIKICLCCTHTH